MEGHFAKVFPAIAVSSHFNCTLSSAQKGCFNDCLFKILQQRHEPEWFYMNKKIAVLATEEDLLVDLTFHNMPASLLTEFAEKIVRPYYRGNINAAIQDLLQKTIAEQDLLLAHITRIRP